jgi:hypothetical protein
MKIIITADNHIFYGDQYTDVLAMMKSIRKENPDVVCNLGDIGEILTFEYGSVKNNIMLQELFSINPTFWVVGNHDLYSRQKYTPPEALEKFFSFMNYGIPLQTSWTDSKTIYKKDDCLFLGTIGFPEFSHPKLIMPLRYYDNGFPTIDAEYINLRGGWLQYTKPLIEAFEKKLQLIDKSTCKNIIILTHYNIFESQYKFNYNDEVSPYFYCHKLGQLVLECAKKNSDKKFYAISGHGHEYNVGQWVQEASNLKTHGIKTTYQTQDYITVEI